jgi:hypothetical protein
LIMSEETVEPKTAPPQPEGGAKVEGSVSPRPQLWTRRRIITLGVSLSAGLIACVWSPLVKKLGFGVPARRSGNPYHRKKKRAVLFFAVSLAEGFWARPKRSTQARIPAKESRVRTNGPKASIRSHRSIIQYVDSQHRVPFVSKIKWKKLRPALSVELASPSVNMHVSFSRASAIFEMAAFQQLKSRQYGKACELLIYGIRHDVIFKGRTHGRPSLRLLDLLANLSVRRNQNQHFDTLLKLVEETKGLIPQQEMGSPAKRKRHKAEGKQRSRLSPLEVELARKRAQDALQVRSKRWKDQTWQQKMKNLETKVQWSMTVPIDTARNENKKESVEL